MRTTVPPSKASPTPHDRYLGAMLEFMNECKLPPTDPEGGFWVSLPEADGLSWTATHSSRY